MSISILRNLLIDIKLVCILHAHEFAQSCPAQGAPKLGRDLTLEVTLLKYEVATGPSGQQPWVMGRYGPWPTVTMMKTWSVVATSTSLVMR